MSTTRELIVLDAALDCSIMDEAANSLRRTTPDYSAATTLSASQRRGLLGVVLATLAALLIAPRPVLVGLVAAATAMYICALSFRILLIKRSLGGAPVVTLDDDAARAVADDDLPHYTVLVPLYGEPEVAQSLVASLSSIDYPRDKLDITVLLEADDEATIEAIASAAGDTELELVVVPPGEPRTKPKACNVGLAFARGDLVTIFDAEDRPDPLQLRKAAVAFLRDPELACLQANLTYYNADQNLLTRWFTAEYEAWFRLLLPGLASMDAPIPLGGTSNHIRRELLVELGGWDPWNVTEDADLGIRLRRAGHRVSVLDSTTREEANPDAINWVKQRSRWYKGYLQTLLVHLRHPVQTWRELGAKGFAALVLFVGGTPLLAALNPVFWTMTILWLVHQPRWIVDLFPAPVYYAAVACWFFGNLSVLYWNLLGVRVANSPGLALAAALTPLYWLLMSAAAIKAIVQLVRAPSYWEKTRHGLATTGGAHQ